MTVGRPLVTAVGHRPDLVVLVHDQRRGLDAHRDLVANGIGLGVDHQNPVLVRPAVGEDILVVLHHLLGRTRLEIHVRLDIPRDLVSPGVDDIDARIPDLGDIGLFVAQEVDVARRSEALDTPHLLEGVDVDRVDHARIIDHDPADAVADDHRLRHIAQFEAVGAEEDLVLDLFLLRIVVGERRVAVHEVALVGDEQPRSGNPEILHFVRPIIHTCAAERRTCKDCEPSLELHKTHIPIG